MLTCKKEQNELRAIIMTISLTSISLIRTRNWQSPKQHAIRLKIGAKFFMGLSLTMCATKHMAKVVFANELGECVPLVSLN